MNTSRSEAAVQAAVRVRLSELGWRAWRNNVGAIDIDGRHIRFGLGNDSATANRALKSSDLIGIRPLLITSEHVGTVIGQFVSLECKHEDWRPSASDERERAQRRWLDLIRSLGGHAMFVQHEDALR